MMGETVVISFKQKKREIASRECKHLTVEIDEKLWHISCVDCGEVINPIWWLLQRALDETLTEYRVEKLKAFLADRKRVKCTHCGKFTPL